MRNILWALLLISATLVPACGGGNDGERRGRGGPRGDREAKDPLVEVVPVRRDNISESERSTGRIEARELADVYAQVTEVAYSVLVDVGDRVQQGQVLARLNRETLDIQVQASMIAVQEAENAHRSNELELVKRKSELDRILRYFDPAKPEESRLYSKEAYETAKLEYDKAVNQMQNSQLALNRAIGELAASQLQLANTVIKAPITGVITERNIRRNELVSANALAFRIADFSILEVKLDVAEASLNSIYEPERLPAISLFGLRDKVDFDTAQAVFLSVTAFRNARFLGYIDRISPVVDEARGMVQVHVRIIQPRDFDADRHQALLDQLDPDSRKSIIATVQRARQGETIALRPGNWVDARISTNVRRDVLLVPGSAITGESEVIWIVKTGEDPEVGVARRVDVSRRRGVRSEGSFELLPAPDDAGDSQKVSAGDLVVVRGQSLLGDQQKVRVKDLTR